MAIVCHCIPVRDRQIIKAVRRGACDLDAVKDETGAATRCGGCEQAVLALIEAHSPLMTVTTATA